MQEEEREIKNRAAASTHRISYPRTKYVPFQARNFSARYCGTVVEAERRLAKLLFQRLMDTSRRKAASDKVVVKIFSSHGCSITWFVSSCKNKEGADFQLAVILCPANDTCSLRPETYLHDTVLLSKHKGG